MNIYRKLNNYWNQATEYVIEETVAPIIVRVGLPIIRWANERMSEAEQCVEERVFEYASAKLEVYEKVATVVDGFFPLQGSNQLSPIKTPINSSQYRDFIMSINKCMKIDANIWALTFRPYETNYEIPSNLTLPYVKIKGALKFHDRVTSLETTFARLFIANPYKGIPYPELNEYLQLILKTREERKKIIEAFRLYPDTTLDELGVDEYELTLDGKAICSVARSKSLTVFDETALDNLLQPPLYIEQTRPGKGYLIPPNYSPEDFQLHLAEDFDMTQDPEIPFDRKVSEHSRRPLIKTIDSDYQLWGCAIHPILNHLSEKTVPKQKLRKLEPLLHDSIAGALYFRSQVYGNRKRFWEIKIEILNASTFDRDLFYAILLHCYSIYQDKLDQENLSNIMWMIDEILGDKNLLGKDTLKDYPETIDRIHMVFDYLNQKVSLEELGIDHEYAHEFLKICKLVDYAMACLNCMQFRTKLKHSTIPIREKIHKIFPEITEEEIYSRKLSPSLPNSSYELRKHILETCPTMSSEEAFTRTIDFKKMKQGDYGKYWIGRRAAEHGKALVNLHIKALANTGNTIMAVRGNTGAGKTCGLKQREGVLNPDSIKWSLRRGTKIKNSQVHFEGAGVYDHYFDEMAAKDDFLFTIDQRFIELEDLYYYVINPAKEKGCSAKIKDFDVPLEASLLRVLTRDPKGENPCTHVEVITDGFRRIRKNRKDIIEAVQKENAVKKYKLIYLGEVIAEKKGDEFLIQNVELLNKCLQEPTDMEIEATLDRVIDEALIEEAVEMKYIYPKQRDLLNKWLGKTLHEAVEELAIM